MKPTLTEVMAWLVKGYEHEEKDTESMQSFKLICVSSLISTVIMHHFRARRDNRCTLCGLAPMRQGSLAFCGLLQEAAAPTLHPPSSTMSAAGPLQRDQLPSEALISFGSKQSHAWLSCLLGHPWGPGDSTHKIHCLSDS